jgi:hypothetical protein
MVSAGGRHSGLLLALLPVVVGRMSGLGPKAAADETRRLPKRRADRFILSQTI